MPFTHPCKPRRKNGPNTGEKAEEMGIAETGFEMGHFLPIRQVQDNPVYAGLVETMDDAVGVVLKALDELGLAENTIVIFTSDNGGVSAGDAFATSNLPLAAGKGYQFEGGIREPYFIKVPGIKPGQKNSVPVTGTDFYPTLLELAGANLKPEEHNDGVSLVPCVKRRNNRRTAAHLALPALRQPGRRNRRPSSAKANWKLIHYYEDGMKNCTTWKPIWKKPPMFRQKTRN
jgi:arylsulfatase A-like enzyme